MQRVREIPTVGDTVTDEQNPTVLVVDDANGVVDIYERWLQEDFEVLTATDGETAIGRRARGVDVVVVDRNLSDLPGSRVVEEIREVGNDPAVVFLSSVEPDYEEFDVEFRECLTKPVMRRELVEAVDGAATGEPTDGWDAGTSGPTLSDHQPDDGATTERGTDDDRSGSEEASGASDEAEPTGDVTDRLRSLRSDLEETASELSDRGERHGDGSDRGIERGTDDPDGASRRETDETAGDSMFDEETDETAGDSMFDGDTDYAARDSTVDRETEDAARREPRDPDSAAEDPGDVAGFTDPVPGGDSDDPDDPDGDPEVSDRESETSTGSPREAIPDTDDTPPADSLQSRVEELASKATELAEGTSEVMAETEREADAEDDDGN